MEERCLCHKFRDRVLLSYNEEQLTCQAGFGVKLGIQSSYFETHNAMRFSNVFPLLMKLNNKLAMSQCPLRLSPSLTAMGTHTRLGGVF